MQNDVGYVMGVLTSLGTVIVGWVSIEVRLEVHLAAAAVIFCCGYANLVLVSRADAFRVQWKAKPTKWDVFWMRYRAFTNILFVVMLAAFSFALCALAGTGEKWLYERHWYRSISPMLEWAYAAGILALHYVGLGGIIGLRAWNAKSFWEALGWRIDGYC